MSSLLLVFLCFTSLLYFGLCGKVKPFGPTPIVLNSSNAGEFADYNFTMSLDNTLPSTGSIEITFPLQQYDLGLGLPINFLVYAPYPNLISCSLSSTGTGALKTVICPVGQRIANESFTISIVGVRNPLKVGGTGMFKIISRVTAGGVIMDSNYNFGVIGLYSASQTLADASIAVETNYSSLAGAITNWIITIVPVDDIPALVDIRVVFPPELFNFNYAQTYQCSADTTQGYALSGPIQCEFNSIFTNYITFVGNNATIPKDSQVRLRMTNFINPKREVTTEFLQIYIVEKDTNNSIQIKEGIPGLVISPGGISDIAFVNPNPLFKLYTGATRTLYLEFRPSNPFNIVRIATSFPSIQSCNVIYGLARKDLKTLITCSTISNVMTITGFATYQPDDNYIELVRVSFQAVLPAVPQTLDPVEIYTYLDQVFLLEVDEDVSTANTRLSIIQGPGAKLSQSSLTASNQSPKGIGTLSFKIETSTKTYTAPNVVTIETGSIFYGIPTCTYTPDSGTAVSVSCTYSGGVITASLTASDIVASSGTANNILQVTGLQNPYATTTYPYIMYVYGKDSTFPTQWGTGSLIIVQFTSLSTTAGFLVKKGLTSSPMILTITPPVLMIDGYQLAEEPYKESSEIVVKFRLSNSGTSWFAYDLGYSSMSITLQDLSTIPCAPDVGFLPSDYTTSVTCDILLGPSSSPSDTDVATVRIRNFAGALPGTVMKIAIPIYNPSSGTTPSISVIMNYYNLNSQYVIASETISPATISADTTSGSNLASLTAVLTASNTQATTTLTVTFSNGGSVSATASSTSIQDSSIIVIYPSAYTIDPAQVVVKLDTVNVLPINLKIYQELSYFTIKLASTLNSGSHTITIDNIQTPSSVVTSNSVNLRISSGNDFVYKESTPATVTPALIPGTLQAPVVAPAVAVPVAMTVTHSQYSHPYATYQFSFGTSKKVVSGNKIVITFPSSYNFGTLTQPPYCDNIVGLTFTAYPVPCTFAGQTVTMTGFADVAIGTAITINIYGIKNPSSAITGSSFVVSITDASLYIIETATVTGTSSMVTAPTFSVQNLNVSTPDLIPNNAIIFGVFSFYMDPGFEIPKGATITITFPSAYELFSNTNTDITCSSDGGLYVIVDCQTPSSGGTTVTMVTGERSDSTIPITLYYVGYSKMNVASTVNSGFAIQVTYQGVNIADTTANPIGSITSGPTLVGSSNINVDLDFYPQNEGEQANYIFTFETTLSTITSDMMFFIRFPADYDPQLCLYNLIVESDDLQGALNGFLVSRDLRITGFYDMTVTGPITIRVWGVVNPNRYDNTVTGLFFAGIIQDDVMLQGNNTISGIVPLLAPDSISLTSLSSTLNNSRYLNDFNFVFLPRQQIKSSQLGGQIYIDFPPDYIIDTYGGECSINQKFSFFVNCINDYNRIKLNSTNDNWDPETDGSLSVTIKSIRNADNDGGTFAFVVSNYDQLNKNVLGRTYNTLNPASLYYTYDGSLISVNDDLPVFVEVGTYTSQITISIDKKATQTLTLTPYTTNSDILITPFPLTLQLGQTSVTFRVGAPRTILLKTFYITWSKTGDALVPDYAPLRRTPLKMVKGVFKRTVSFENMEYIPRDGVSYPLMLSTDNPPYTNLKINLVVLSGSTTIHFDTLLLSFQQYQFAAYYSFSVDLAYASPNVQIQFTLFGTDSPSYQLPYDSVAKVHLDTLTIPVVAPETSTPTINAMTLVTAKKTSATIQIDGTTLAFIYFVIGNNGMPVPTFPGVQNTTANLTLEYSNPIYNVTYIKLNPRTVVFDIPNLKPGIYYVLYAYIMNLNRIFNPQISILRFYTLAPDKPAEFIMMIKQSSVSSDLKQEYFVRIAAMISVDKSRVIEKNTNCIQSTDSAYSAPNSTFVHVYILPDPTNENADYTPANLVSQLNQRVAEIVLFIPRLASGDLLQRGELAENIPAFTSKPKWTYSDTGSMAFTVQMTACGWINAVAVPVALSRNNTASNATIFEYETPLDTTFQSSYQTYANLTVDNQLALNTTMRVFDVSTTYTLNITGLADKLIYHIFITAQNDWPEYNLLMADKDVARIEAKTIKIRKPLNIYSINNGSFLQISLASLFLIMSILLH